MDARRRQNHFGNVQKGKPQGTRFPIDRRQNETSDDIADTKSIRYAYGYSDGNNDRKLLIRIVVKHLR